MDCCEICGNSTDNKYYIVPETMYGMGEEFKYMECSQCGCLQLPSPPDDLSRYYGDNYYSMRNRHNNPIRTWLDRKRYRYAIAQKGSWLGKFLLKKYGFPAPNFVEWVKRTNLQPDDSVLDVGCGMGHLLRQMAKAGFQNLTGIDPYLAQQEIVANGVRLQKKSIAQMSGQYDRIVMHHSFEHMPDPLEVLQHAYKLLKPGGYAIVDIPLIGYAWRKYGVNWVALDAPRHLYLHTVSSMKILAQKAEFQVTDIVYNSHAYQFWGSEQIARGIPIRSDRSHADNPKESIFSQEDMKSFHRQAQELNRQKDGDSASFYLYKQ
jgi:2-polyprenyl-3-methyl-5-hydroxy-6-metoxy-1,4-benzoquinol methylase